MEFRPKTKKAIPKNPKSQKKQTPEQAPQPEMEAELITPEFFDQQVHEPERVLRLQRTIGNRAANRMLRPESGEQHSSEQFVSSLMRSESTATIQRAGKTKSKTYSEIEVLSLKDLKEYIDNTPDWDKESTLTKTNIKTIRDIAAFTGVDGVIAVLGTFTMKSLLDEAGALNDKLDNLRSFIKAVTEDKPFSVTKASTMKKANQWGEAIKKLKAAFPEYVLSKAMNERAFKLLITGKIVDDVISYYTTASQKPVFQAEAGRDFIAYYNLRKAEGKDPLQYDATVLSGKIRNYHRFEKAALDQLVINFGDKSKTKPLTVILHTAIDHNGAFHRDSKLTALIKNGNINAILIEGGETLASYQNQIAPLAQAYGMHGKIDQVMFAGHGGSRVIEMAGTVEQDTKTGKLKEKGEAIDLKHDKVKADAFFEEVLKNMEHKYAKGFVGKKAPQQKNRRILFNACLTNSHAVEYAKLGDTAKAKKEIKKFIKNNQSLASYLGDKAKSEGYNVTSLGANASIGQVDLSNSKGQLDMVSTADPKVTASKLEYAEHGREPLGTMRAALETWALDEANLLAAIGRRANGTSTKWDDALIEEMYKTTLDLKTKGYHVGQVLGYYAQIAHNLSELKQESHANVSAMKSYMSSGTNTFIEPLMNRLMTTSDFTSRDYIPLIVYQLMLNYNATWGTQLITHLGTKYTVKTGRKFIDISYLQSKNFLAGLYSGADSTGKRVLALIGVMGDTVDAESKKYLKKIRTPEAPEVPGLPAVPAVAAVPRKRPPRRRYPSVPAVPGRPAVKAIPGKRVAVAAVPGLPALPELPAVKGLSFKKLPGRPGRPKRDAVAAVPKVEAHFAASLGIEALLDGTATEDKVHKKLI